MVLTTSLRRVAILALGLLPFIYLMQAVVRVQSGEWDLLGPEPSKAITHFTGSWAFNFLVITLAVTPMVQKARQRWLMKHRRMLGLFAFFYASLHGLAWYAFLLEWNWRDLASEIAERPYLLLGAAAWLLMLPMAVTSTRNWQRRLGRQWKRLHRVIYLVAVLACLHYLLQIRAGWFEPVAYTVMTAIVLLLRTKKTS